MKKNNKYRTVKTNLFYAIIAYFVIILILISAFLVYINFIAYSSRTATGNSMMIMAYLAFIGVILFLGKGNIWAVIETVGVGYIGFYKPKIFLEWANVCEIGIGYHQKTAYIYFSNEKLNEELRMNLSILYGINGVVIAQYHEELNEVIKKYYQGEILEYRIK